MVASVSGNMTLLLLISTLFFVKFSPFQEDPQPRRKLGSMIGFFIITPRRVVLEEIHGQIPDVVETIQRSRRMTR